MPKTVRVFLSSTFRDMHAERDHLMRLVFPELRERCRKRGAEFVAIDLRWGVTEEEARREGALSICLDEIERCRPFFLCLLGERYGWAPPPEEVPVEAFERARNDPGLTGPERLLLDHAYRRDDTAAPACYRLRREIALAAADSEQLVAFWEVRGLPHAGESITAREILRGVMEPGYPATHALFYLRTPVHEHPDFPPAFVPIFREENARRRLQLAELKKTLETNPSGWLVRRYSAGYAGLRIDPSLLPKGLTPADLAALRDGVIQPAEWPAVSDAVREAGRTHGTVALDGVDNLGRSILEDLWHVVQKELDRPVPVRDDHDRDRANHERFVVDRTRLFVGRDDLVRRLLSYGEAPGRFPLVVAGQPGSGKSALLAEAARRLRTQKSDAAIIPYFIGAAPGSTDLTAMVRSLCVSLKRECGLADELPTDPEQLRRALPLFLEQAAAKRQVILLIDALNQLDPAFRSHELEWLPTRLPAGAKLIVSTLPGRCLDRLREQTPAEHVVPVPPLSREDRALLVERFLAQRRKRLAAEQLERLLDPRVRAESGLPLYLLVALDELCLFGDYSSLGQRIDQLPPTTAELFDQVLSRLEHDHGRELTAAVCGWLTAARSGLLETELLDLLKGRLPGVAPLHWTGLYRALQFYLRPMDEEFDKGGRIAFFHDQLRFAASRRYCLTADAAAKPTDASRGIHRELATYFRGICRGEGSPPRWRVDRPRGLAELPFHLIHSEQWDELAPVLCDLSFVEAKCLARMAFDLQGDYAAALAAWPGHRRFDPFERSKIGPLAPWYAECVADVLAGSLSRHRERGSGPVLAALHGLPAARRSIPLERQKPIFASEQPFADDMMAGYAQLPTHAAAAEMRATQAAQDRGELLGPAATPVERVQVFADFVSAHIHVLNTSPGAIVPLAFNHAGEGPVAQAAAPLVAEWSRPWIAQSPRPRLAATRPLIIRTLEGHRDSVDCVAATPDGGRVVSGGSDNTVRLWDAALGQCLRVLDGHTSTVAAIALSHDGRRAISGGNDETLRVWDLTSGECVRVLNGHEKDITGVALTPDGGLAVSSSEDQTVRVWDVAQGRCLKILRGHKDNIRSVAVSADGRIAASGDWGTDDAIRIWDVAAGKTLAAISLRHGRLAMTANASLIFADAEIVSLLSQWRVRTFAASWRKTAATLDGRIAIGYGSRKFEMFDSTTGQSLRGVDCASEVSSLAVSDDGRLVVTAHLDGRVRVWDMATGMAAPSSLPHRDAAEIQIAPDGRHAISAGGSTARIWDLPSGAAIGEPMDIANPRGFALSPSGRWAAIVDRRSVEVWDLHSAPAPSVSSRMSARLKQVIFTPDESGLVGMSEDGELKVLARDSGDVRSVLPLESDKVRLQAVTRDGRFALGVSSDSRLQMWDLARRRIAWTANGYWTGGALAETPDGTAIVRRTSNLEILDRATGKPLGEMGELSSGSVLAMSPHGRDVVITGKNGELEIWDLGQKTKVRTLKGPGGVDFAAITPDGQFLLAAGNDAKLFTVWEMSTGRCRAVYPILVKVNALSAVRPDGSFAVGAYNGSCSFMTLRNLRFGPPIVTAARVLDWSSVPPPAPPPPAPAKGFLGKLFQSAPPPPPASPPPVFRHRLLARCLHCAAAFTPSTAECPQCRKPFC